VGKGMDRRSGRSNDCQSASRLGGSGLLKARAIALIGGSRNVRGDQRQFEP
jgi:hypothetical protein